MITSILTLWWWMNVRWWGTLTGATLDRAILGLRAEEIHLCMAPEAESIVTSMIKRCKDQYRIVRHKRNTRLTVEKKPYSLKNDLRKGDALIVFSKKSVLALAAHLESQGVRCSVIYGSLPPATRREQVRRFLEKETDIVVSTDAIGMGTESAYPPHCIRGDPEI